MGLLPIDLRDELAALLTDQDVETLRHLVNQGMGDNTLRALTSDLAYLETWRLAATGRSLPWPVSEPLLLKFVAHHLWDPQRREQRKPAAPRVSQNCRPACASDGTSAPSELVDTDQVARPRRFVPLP